VPPALPGRILPERSVPCLEPFDHPDFLFSIDWDGSRALLFASPHGVRLQTQTLADSSAAFPGVVDAGRALQASSAVLDGVVTVLDPAGCPDLTALGERMALGAGVDARLPTVFLATDLLHLGGRATMGLPCAQRLDLLRGLELGTPRIQVPDWVVGEGVALADAASSRNLPALLARRSDSRYHPGVASRDRLSVSLRQRADCVVVAAERVTTGGMHRRRLRLAEHHGGRLAECARVELPETSTLWRWAAPGGRLRAPLIATVEHQGRDAEGALRHPRLVTLRDDIDPEWCLRRDPVPPPAGPRVSARGFRPTVLSALPLEVGGPSPPSAAPRGAATPEEP
jgi:ATP-dependent DNA ligase